MGLDNYWELPEGAEEPKFEEPLGLCGGLFSGDGGGSFRGKVYAELVESITDVSLYTDRIDNETVRFMAQKLSETSYEEALEYDTWNMFQCEVWRDEDDNELNSYDHGDADDLTLEEHKKLWKNFQTMFMTYAEAGAELISWY